MSEQPDLRGRDSEILIFLEQEELHHFTFDGLQHSLQLHPETLTRSLTRLEADGHIQKHPDGYRILHPHGAHPAQLTSHNTIQLAQTLLPAQTNPTALLNALRGRWFGRLRWLGYSAGRANLTLKWVTENGQIRLSARLEGPLLTIQAALQDHANLDEAVQVSHQLLSQLSTLYSHPQARLTTYILTPSYAAAM